MRATPSSFRRYLFVIPAQAGIQRGGAKAVKAEFHAIIIAP